MRVNLGKYPGIRSKRDRVISVRIDPWDTWNTDHTLALIILPLLKQLRETKHGSPCVPDDLVPEELKSTSASPTEHEWDIDDNWHLRWEWVLDQMIWSFQQIVDGDWEDQFHTGELDIRWEPVEVNGHDLYEMTRGPNDTSHFDAEGHRAYSDRIDNGLKLFGIFFRSLWD